MTTQTDRPSPLMIRGVDPDLWHQVRVEALKRKITAGEMLNEILRAWLDRELAKLEDGSANGSDNEP